ncbi:MAG: DUF1330 domain-containing protein [Burkholderiales bacterium]|nr:DUF1330 domain-containing protein [Burkholderiales bacterium]
MDKKAYVVGHISVKDEALWAEYRARVPDTLAPWRAELVCRGHRVAVWAGEGPHTDLVVIRFENVEAASAWFHSAAYQALIPLRQQAADVVLVCYEE